MTKLSKLICVDDDVATLDALERVLRKEFMFIRATAGAEALDLLKKESDVAIILSDYRMPGMNGIDFLNQAKEIHPLSTRAILTGQMDLTDLMAAVNSQAIHRLILKPWDNSYLIVQMREALQTHLLLKQKQDLEILSITDPVTGASNHRHFQEVLKREIDRAIRHSRPLTMMMIDVDHFKAFNDRYGHPDGDRLLRSIAEFLKQELRGIDLLFRYGGEEFAAILPDTNTQDAFSVAERLRENLSQSKIAPSRLTVSIGVAGLNDDITTPQSLIEAADQGLYLAKGQGRNKTIVQNKVDTRSEVYS